MPPKPGITIRNATEPDLPALLSLLLTSFRQFPLFNFLYSPLESDISTAHDTVFFWRRRLLLDLLDPDTAVIVAETEREEGREARPETRELRDRSEAERQSWRMLEWVTAQGGLSQTVSPDRERAVVGFAIWNSRKGHAVQVQENRGSKSTARSVDWGASLRVKALHLEGYLWKALYTRKDQDRERYAAYLAAEEELERQFYAESCYYLDNLCVDFRYQRMGIGGLLLQWGLDYAKKEGLPVQTEAGPMGVGLYTKVGFKEIGIWNIEMVNSEQEQMELPVMRWEG